MRVITKRIMWDLTADVKQAIISKSAKKTR